MSAIKTTKLKEVAGQTFIFDKRNYIIMIIGLLVILIGFIFMIGGGSDNPNVFNPAIFDFQRITLAPILVISGFVIEVFAIMLKPADKSENN